MPDLGIPQIKIIFLLLEFWLSSSLKFTLVKIFNTKMEIDFISSLHKSTKRDYLARINDKNYPKYKAAKLAAVY